MYLDIDFPFEIRTKDLQIGHPWSPATSSTSCLDVPCLQSTTKEAFRPWRMLLWADSSYSRGPISLKQGTMDDFQANLSNRLPTANKSKATTRAVKL